MGFGPLRVINEDYIRKGEGFPTHGHKDMEIITYMVAGELEHRDSTGSHGVIRPGEVQKMSAGKGIRHSEFNHSKENLAHLLQIWIHPKKNSITPGYQQTDFGSEIEKGDPVLLVSPTGEKGSLTIIQDAEMWIKRFIKKDTWNLELSKGHSAWFQLVKGEIFLNDHALHAGDGAGVESESLIKIRGGAGAEVLFFRFMEGT